jgi:hypothetical protein
MWFTQVWLVCILEYRPAGRSMRSGTVVLLDWLKTEFSDGWCPHVAEAGMSTTRGLRKVQNRLWPELEDINSSRTGPLLKDGRTSCCVALDAHL